MRTRSPVIPLVIAAVAAAALVVGGMVGWAAWKADRFVDAVSLAPAGSQRVLFTDWAAVRAEVSYDAGADPAEALVGLLDRGFRRDLTSTSALTTSAESLREHLGVSPATLDWEVFAQSTEGAVVIMRAPGATEDLPERLRAAGFAEPADEHGVWLGGPDVTAALGRVSPEVGHWALLPDDLLLTSDNAAFLERAAADVMAGGGLSDAARHVAGAVDDPISAVLLEGAYACEALAMAGADADEQAEADGLIEQAGEVTAYEAMVTAIQPGGAMRVAMAFDDGDEARTNADARAALVSGAAVGQGGDFADRFRVDDVLADGDTLTLHLTPEPGTFPLSDLTSGPVLYAAC